ncbi:MAG: hypothetical protein RQ732_10755 [Methylophaga sp.]|nr:hypothetical protein [Methylophaga sp.]
MIKKILGLIGLNKWLILGAISAISVSFAAAWQVQDWRYGQQIAEMENNAYAKYLQLLNRKNEIDLLTRQRQQVVLEADELRKKQQKIVTRTITKEVIRYVQDPDAGNCRLPDRWVRIHDAAAGGSVDLPGDSTTTTKPDESATKITDIEALGVVTENYGTCQQLRNQLTSLQEWVRSTYEE